MCFPIYISNMNNKFRIWILLIAAVAFNALTASQIKAQSAMYDFADLGIFPSDNATASAKVSCPPALNTIEIGIIEANKKRHNYGYSVQLYFDSGLDAQKKAENVAAKFKKDFKDDHEAYVFYDAPYFKVRAGDCRTRLEATRLKKQVESQFPGCFIIECKISYPKL